MKRLSALILTVVVLQMSCFCTALSETVNYSEMKTDVLLQNITSIFAELENRLSMKEEADIFADDRDLFNMASEELYALRERIDLVLAERESEDAGKLASSKMNTDPNIEIEPEYVATPNTTDADYEIRQIDNETCEITSYIGTEANPVIPVSINGLKVAKIGDDSFNRNKIIESITLPAELKTIGKSAFEWCPNLKQVIFPDGLNTIENESFYGCELLDNVILPEGLKHIGENAFAQCYALKKLVFPETLVFLGDMAFRQCDALTQVVLPASLKRTGAYTFSFCDVLSKVILPENLECIEECAFKGCDNLTSISLPDSLNSIEGNPFLECDNLLQIKVSAHHQVFEVIDNVLFDKNSKKLICYPNALSASSYTVPAGTRIIGKDAFALDGWRWGFPLKSITLPEGLDRIETNAFRYSFLTSIALPDSVKEIEACAFSQCAQLKNVTLSNGLQAIAKNAFNGTKNITSIVIPEDVTCITKDTFAESPDVTYTVVAGSYMHLLAQQAGMKFVLR